MRTLDPPLSTLAMATPLHLLMLEHNLSDAALVLHELHRYGYEPIVARVETEQDFRKHLHPIPEIILADFSLPGFNALRALEIVQGYHLDIPFIIVSGTIGEERAVQVMQRGVTDYIIKDRMGRLGQAVNQALEQKLFRDAKRRTEQALFESERRFSGMLGNLQLIALMLDSEAKITYCNDYLLQLTDWRREEVLGGNWFDLFLAPPHDLMKAAFSNLLKDMPNAWHFENTILTQAGEQRVIHWNNSVLRSATGDVIGTASIGEDISERKRLGEQLRQAQKLESIGLLAGGIAHDFNNLLTVINGRSALMIMRGHPDEKMRSQLELIAKTGERAATLTRQLLAFSRQQVLQPKVLNLNTVAGEIEEMLRRLIPEDIALKTVFEPSLPLVLADPSQIEQVILNLVVNARDAMPTGGKLIIETAKVELSEAYCRMRDDVNPGHFVMLSVSDTGTGMATPVTARVFEPFFTSKVIGKGTGLGLSTVYGIVKQSNGHIEVFSELGKGTVFKIYLPHASSVLAPIKSEDALGALSSGTETILLVEDEEGVRDLVRDFLEMDGYTVFTAPNGKVALQVCAEQKKPFDLLITDVVMPEMGGPELVAHLRKSRPEWKVLFTSGYVDRALAHNGTIDPDVHFIQKPFTPENLARKVRDILDAKIN